MKISADEIAHVATLARLDMDGAVMAKFQHQVGQILDYVKTLDELDTEGVSLTSHVTSSTNAFREDRIIPSPDVEACLSNAPSQEEGYFIVPKVIG